MSNMFEVQAWFPTLISSGFLEDIDNDSLTEHSYLLRDTLKYQPTTWNCDTYNTINFPKEDQYLGKDSDKVIDNLVTSASSAVEQYAELFSANLEDYKIVCRDIWFNIASPGHFQEFHNHPNSHFSAVYYVQAEPNAGNIIFKNLENFAEQFIIPYIGDKDSIGSFKSCYYIPEPGKLLIFRSNLLHMVEQNASDKDRISVAMNFVMEKK